MLSDVGENNIFQETENIFGFVLLQSLLFEDINDGKGAERSAVHTRSCHGIIDICNADDLGEFVDAVSGQTERISTAITTLVVHKGGIFDVIVDRLVLQDFVALDRMRFDHVVFLIGQAIRFFDDRIGNAELADIVKQTTKRCKLGIFL